MFKGIILAASAATVTVGYLLLKSMESKSNSETATVPDTEKQQLDFNHLVHATTTDKPDEGRVDFWVDCFMDYVNSKRGSGDKIQEGSEKALLKTLVYHCYAAFEEDGKHFVEQLSSVELVTKTKVQVLSKLETALDMLIQKAEMAAVVEELNESPLTAEIIHYYERTKVSKELVAKNYDVFRCLDKAARNSTAFQTAYDLQTYGVDFLREAAERV